MCGICGIVSKKKEIDAMECYRMVEALAPRGPDGWGLYAYGFGKLSREEDIACTRSPVLLGHTRLSIIDLTGAASQPMQNACGSIWITYNGEIYNYQEVRKDLQNQGYFFKSESDTEVILAAYEMHGSKCVEFFRGMFAFAIWDVNTEKLLIGRDRIGIKPLYYFCGDGVFAFASEVKALLRLRTVSKELDPISMYNYFRSGRVIAPRTIVSGIHTVPAASVITYRGGSLGLKKYWKLSPEPNLRCPREELPERVEKVFTETIGLHLLSDRPVGLFLSGGLDSTVLLSVINKLGFEGLRTFSIALGKHAEDEGIYARLAAEAYKSEHIEWQVDDSEIPELFPQFLDSMDQPSIDGFNIFLVSRLASQNNVPVAISGLGGDELFGGYDGFQRIPRWLRMAKCTDNIPYAVRSAISRALQRVPSTRLDKACEIMLTKPDVFALYGIYRGLFSDQRLRRLLNPDILEIHNSGNAFAETALDGNHLQDEYGQNDIDSLMRTLGFLEMTDYMQNQLLRDTDVASMTNGVEVRVPMLDHELVEFLLTIPNDIRRLERPGKRFLTSIAGDIPNEIAGRSKMGFTLPIGAWMRTSLKPSVDAMITSAPESYFKRSEVQKYYSAFLNGSHIHWSRVFAVFILCSWLQRNELAIL